MLQNDIKYSIIGTSNAPDYFRIEEKSGQIKKDLRDDTVKMDVFRVSRKLTL